MNLYGGCKSLNERRKETPHFNVALVNTCSSMPSHVRFRFSIIFLPRFHTSSSLSLAFFLPAHLPERLIYYRKSLVNIFIIGFFSSHFASFLPPTVFYESNNNQDALMGRRYGGFLEICCEIAFAEASSRITCRGVGSGVARCGSVAIGASTPLSVHSPSPPNSRSAKQ